MTLVRFNPMRGLERFERRINELVNELDKGVTFEMGGYNPRVDITEDEKNLYFHIEIPGIKKEDVKVSVNEERMLTVKGEKAQKNFDEKERSFLRTERTYGSFTRTFMLPDNANVDNIQAKCENGVLELQIPKKEPEQPKEININIS